MKTVERLMHSARSTDAACHHARFRSRGPSRSANSAAAEPMPLKEEDVPKPEEPEDAE